MKHYVGLDLHSDNSYIAIMDQEGDVCYTLKVYKRAIIGIAMESSGKVQVNGLFQIAADFMVKRLLPAEGLQWKPQRVFGNQLWRQTCRHASALFQETI